MIVCCSLHICMCVSCLCVVCASLNVPFLRVRLPLHQVSFLQLLSALLGTRNPTTIVQATTPAGVVLWNQNRVRNDRAVVVSAAFSVH